MKRIVLAVLTVIFVFVLAGFSMAANDFQIQGTVTKINGNQITIKDNKGKEVSIVGNANGLKTGDKVFVNVSIRQQETPRKLTAEEKEFLTNQCQINPAELDIIPELGNDNQAVILNGVAQRDCSKLASFKASREYYRRLNPGAAIPLAPVGWAIDWLTDKEFQRYLDILNNAPW
ncbi:MAG TPA: hypothetical protein VMU29_14315 [Smithella sp.]|nr:hypothetical protein [Smithella sp.]